MTFRHYRPDFAPRTSTSPPVYVGTPLCACGVPCTLRPDGRGRVKASLAHSARLRDSVPAEKTRSDEGRPEQQLFFWVCNAGAANEGKTCGHFRLLDMRKEGRGRWYRPGREDDEGGGQEPGPGSSKSR